MKTVLITGIGGDIAQGVATILRESGRSLTLYGTDMSLEHGGSLFVEEVFPVPAASSDDYLPRMKEIIETHSIDLVIPMSEPELAVCGPMIDQLGEDRCITVGKDAIAIGVDKLETIRVLSELGIQTPWSMPAGDQTPPEFPCILKSQRGSGSKNVFVVDTADEAAFLAKKFPGSIFQEMLEPADLEVTCAVYRTRDGKTSVLQLLRKLTGGATGWARVIDDQDTREMCEAIAEGIGLRGSINVQLRITNAGPRVFEINPRFSSTLIMRHRLGFSDLLWAIDEAAGESIDFPIVTTGQSLARVYNAEIIN